MDMLTDTDSEVDEYMETGEPDSSAIHLSRPLPAGPRNPGYLPIRLLRILETMTAASSQQTSFSVIDIYYRQACLFPLNACSRLWQCRDDSSMWNASQEEARLLRLSSVEISPLQPWISSWTPEMRLSYLFMNIVPALVRIARNFF